MKRQNPIQIAVKQDGKHFAVLVEEQLVALAVYRKGAETLEALLRGLRRYTSRKFFRLALKDALNPAKAEAKPKPKNAQNDKPAPKAKATKATSKAKTLAKAETPATSAPAAPVEQPNTPAETVHESTAQQP
jgi:hypothetical protein